ncbi:MAG: sigma-54-dependent Fis family transcriptional regulator, partial [Deltaproteobacteria bacterium]|nr:sigma-54-dependent Fis family transcriptional regulator [Deltaproteobacteria bacterium]
LAEEALLCEVATLEQELKGRSRFQSMIGKSKEMQEVYSLLENLADTDTTVLITGESGTGKELVARALHYSSARSARPMVSVNCSALTESLLESELFGHVRGAFTGAVKDKQGRFQLAQTGTILLDEIGDISPLIQLKLLRVLQEKEFERVGDATPIKADVRVIAATNCELKDKVARGEFREDLYYRLKVVEVHLPPLRRRRDDIPLLTAHFFALFKDRFKKPIQSTTDEVHRMFLHYPWPGNIRELEHALEHAFILCNTTTIAKEHLPAEITSHTELTPGPAAAKPGISPANVMTALTRTGWNKARAARLLGISRPTLYQLMKKHNLTEPTGTV